MKNSCLQFFKDFKSEKVCESDLISEIEKYNKWGSKIFIGTDSMLRSNICTMVTAICLHSTVKKSSNFFYSKKRMTCFKKEDLRSRIMKEVEFSIWVAKGILIKIPDAKIEIHADIGKTHKSLTRSLIDPVSGWVLGLGFDFRAKPESWASSSVADWFTK